MDPKTGKTRVRLVDTEDRRPPERALAPGAPRARRSRRRRAPRRARQSDESLSRSDTRPVRGDRLEPARTLLARMARVVQSSREHGPAEPEAVPREAALRQDARAFRYRRAKRRARRPALRHPEARRAEPALRLPPRARRRAALVVGAEGPEPVAGREAARGAHRGPPARLRGLRGHDPEGRVRRRRGDRVGPRHVGGRRATRGRGSSAGGSPSTCTARSSAGAGTSCARSSTAASARTGSSSRAATPRRTTRATSSPKSRRAPPAGVP